MLAPDPRFEIVDRMDGLEFEAAVVELLLLGGAEDVEQTPRFDKGADIVATIDGVRTAVQVKRWSAPVDLKSVRQLVDGIRQYDCERGLLVTNSYLTERALNSALTWDIEVWDRQTLADYLPGEAPVTNNRTCAECGTGVTPGVTGWCLSHPGRFGGFVFCRDHQARSRRRTT